MAGAATPRNGPQTNPRRSIWPQPGGSLNFVPTVGPSLRFGYALPARRPDNGPQDSDRQVGHISRVKRYLEVPGSLCGQDRVDDEALATASKSAISLGTRKMTGSLMSVFCATASYMECTSDAGPWNEIP